MSRATRRELKKTFQKDIVEFFKIQNHFLPSFIKDLCNVKDPRHKSYINYGIEEILYAVIMKNVCSITSMQDMTDTVKKFFLQYTVDEKIRFLIIYGI